MPTVTVRQGDTITSLAFEHGFFPQTLWDLAENAALRELRGNPDVLFPGDEVFIPELRVAHAGVRTDATHTFRRRGVPAKTRLQLFAGTTPRAHEPYALTVGGTTIEGTTDGDGRIEAFIPPNARRGRLDIGSDSFAIAFGTLDPITEASGVRQRLANLGMLGDEAPPELQLEAAVRRLQRHVGSEQTGVLDARTREALAALHDAPSAPEPQP